MRRPARLPTTEDELVEWSVYTDWLLAQGDRRGELMALELALPAAPDRDALARFLSAVRRPYRERPATPIGWCLGHARTLGIVPEADRPEAAWVTARAILESPEGALVESLEVACTAEGELAPWRRVFDVLPPTCTRVLIKWDRWPDEARAEAVLALLPETVRELAIEYRKRAGRPPLASFVVDRFAVVDFSGLTIGGALAEPIAAALAHTRSVAVRVDEFTAASLPWERCQLGRPGAPALLQPRFRHAISLGRSPLLQLQRTHGPIVVRAQIARTLPEHYAVNGYDNLIHVYRDHSNLRCVADAWTLRRNDERPHTVNGAMLEPDAIVPLHDGDRIGIHDAEAIFVSRDVTQQAAALCR